MDLRDAFRGIGLGCMPMSFGYLGETDDDPVELIRRAVELGVTHVDTSDVYGPFTNEALVGEALEPVRDRVGIATKVGLLVGPNGGYPLVNDARPEHIVEAVEASLRRLRVDEIDLYYLHRIDPAVPLEESWGAMAGLVDTGKVRALGLSEVTIEQLEAARSIHPVTALQSELSLWTREALDDVVPWCLANGVVFVPFSPLGRGFLTGTITRASFEDLDFRANNPRFTPEAIDANLAIVDRVRAVGERHGATPAQIALAWVLAQGHNIAPIPGTKRLRYLEEDLSAATIILTEDDRSELDALPPAVGARY